MTEILEIQSQICLNVSRMMQGIIGAISRGVWGGGNPLKVSTPFIPGCEKVNQKSFFKSAENRGASSLWVGDHRYTSSACASKRIWV